MAEPDPTAALAARFERLGATDPEGWARSQIKEGIPQLARYLFLRQAWRAVVADGDTSWIGPEIEWAERTPDGPGAGVGLALKRLLAAGADPADLADLVRGAQASYLSALCYLLDDPGDVEPEAEGVAWRLFQVDEDGEPVAPMGGLHESVLGTDPTGRETRPRRAA